MSENNTETLNETMTLDGQPVTQEKLDEARKKPNVKIIEVNKGEYKTLARMQG